MTAQIYSKEEFASLLFSSHAVSVWNHKTGPVFWYAAGVPGPFYVNTEKLIGEEASTRLLQDISRIVALPETYVQKSAALETLVMEEYARNQAFQCLIATLIDRATTTFPHNYDCVSGGERRDWFFSIPFAHETGHDHFYIFKDHAICSKKTGMSLDPAAKRVLHISDLINNAASYFDAWLPALEKHALTLAGTACLISRGSVGVERLKNAGISTCALQSVDSDLFAALSQSGLIDSSVYEEIRLYFTSREDWGRRYIAARPDFMQDESIAPKSKERRASFMKNDPWNLWGKP